MKVFLSWSGEASHSVAKAFNEWLPTVLQNVSPWLSSDQIQKGATWLLEIKAAIQASNGFGLFFLTAESLSSPWLLFEAGGVAALEQRRVCTVLVGIDNSEVQAPLKFFQSTKLTQADVFALIETMNSQLETPLSAQVLEKAFTRAWPDLEQQIALATSKQAPAASHPRPDTTALLDRMSGGLEGIEARLARLEEDSQRANARNSAALAQLTAEIRRLTTTTVNGGRGLRVPGLGLSDVSALSDLIKTPGGLLNFQGGPTGSPVGPAETKGPSEEPG